MNFARAEEALYMTFYERGGEQGNLGAFSKSSARSDSRCKTSRIEVPSSEPGTVIDVLGCGLVDDLFSISDLTPASVGSGDSMHDICRNDTELNSTEREGPDECTVVT